MLFAASTIGTILVFVCSLPGNLMILRGILNWGDVSRGIKFVMIGFVLLMAGAALSGFIAKLFGVTII